MSDRTEEPTPRRLRQARREGDVAVSHAVLQAAAMVVAVVLASSAARATARECIVMLRSALGASQELAAPVSPARWMWTSVELSAPMLLAVMATVALAGGLQTGGLVSWVRVAPDLGRLSPASLLRTMISPQRAMAVLRSLVAMLVVAYVAGTRLCEHLPELVRSAGRAAAALEVSAAIAGSMARDVCVVLVALAALDIAWVRRAWRKGLRMTRAEVKRDQRQAEGDPHVKAARRRAHQEMLEAATLRAVRDATVVIVNPVRLANALRYRQDEDDAPVLLAKGEGVFAQKIVEFAHACAVPVVQDVPVARALSELEEGETIPASMYEAVAVILRDLMDAQGSDARTP